MKRLLIALALLAGCNDGKVDDCMKACGGNGMRAFSWFAGCACNPPSPPSPSPCRSLP